MIFSPHLSGQSADAANIADGVHPGTFQQGTEPMTAAFAGYAATPVLEGGQASFEDNMPLSARRRRETCSAPGFLVGAVKSMIRFSTAGASGLVAAANQEIATRVLSASPSKPADTDCTTAPSMSECQRQPESLVFDGGTAEDFQRWQSRVDRLDGLISFRGKYGGLPIIVQLRIKWRDGQPSESARAPYLEWQRTGSYASFMDAVVAELKESGDYDRLVDQRLAIGRRRPNYEKEIRIEMLLNPGKDRRWVEAAMHDFLSDWDRFKGDSGEPGVLGRKLVLWKLLEGERIATQA